MCSKDPARCAWTSTRHTVSVDGELITLPLRVRPARIPDAQRRSNADARSASIDRVGRDYVGDTKDPGYCVDGCGRRSSPTRRHRSTLLTVRGLGQSSSVAMAPMSRRAMIVGSVRRRRRRCSGSAACSSGRDSGRAVGTRRRVCANSRWPTGRASASTPATRSGKTVVHRPRRLVRDLLDLQGLPRGACTAAG